MQAPKTLEAISNPHCGWFYRAKSAEFGQITGSPIAYWVTAGERQVFADNPPISQAAVAKEGLSTADNARFLRLWYEVSWDRIGLAMSSRSQAQASGKKWFPCNKGGQFRKWYGNHEYVINWQNDGSQLRSFCDDRGKSRSVIRNPHHYFLPSLSWGMITSAANAFRYYPAGWINDHAAGCAFPITEQAAMPLLCYLNSHFVNRLTKTINPTINFPPGTFNKLPMPRAFLDKLEASVGERLVAIAKEDWDSQETSWEFVTSPFLQPQFREESLETSYRKIRAHWQALTKEMQQLETQCNQLFLETYALEGAISAEVSLGEITLINNPYYRYGGERTEAQLEELALADSARDLVSYAVGCMFGRYALEKPGLILASQGQTLSDYNHFVYGSQALPDRVFAPVKDNIVPVLSERWFANDAASRLVEFVELAFGKTNLRRNLAFLEGALGKELDSYLLKDFYSDHQRRYRKRPIYWMFASPKGAFKVLVYMHRYDANTLRLVLADYIEDYMAKAHNEQNQIELMLRQDNNDSLAVRRWQKRSAMLSRIATETSLYHRVLYDLVYSSDPEVDISSLDLDEGVKRNYARFKPAIVAI